MTIERTYWACKRLKSHKGMDGRWQVDDPKDAILISSLTKSGLHAPCLDFDIPGMVVPWEGKWRHVMAYGLSRDFVKTQRALHRAGLVDDSFWTSVIHTDSGGPRDLQYHSIVYNVPVRAIPSSDPYKHHFYIDAEISWDAYQPIIEAMKDDVLLEFNFAKFSVEREMTMLLKPGLKKSDMEAMGVVIEENSDGSWVADNIKPIQQRVGPEFFCAHPNIDKGQDEFTPDRCRDCFQPIYPR